MSALREMFAALSNSLKWWVIVAPWEQALRVRGGKTAGLLQSGVHFRVPFWDRVYLQPIRLRAGSTSPQTLETLDGRVLSLQLLVTFQVGDLLRLYSSLHSPSDTLTGLVTGEASKHVQSTDSGDLSPGSIIAAVKGGLQDQVSAYGLARFDVAVVNFVYTSKTYRLITGGLESNVWDGSISMHHDRERE